MTVRRHGPVEGQKAPTEGPITVPFTNPFTGPFTGPLATGLGLAPA